MEIPTISLQPARISHFDKRHANGVANWKRPVKWLETLTRSVSGEAAPLCLAYALTLRVSVGLAIRRDQCRPLGYIECSMSYDPSPHEFSTEAAAGREIEELLDELARSVNS